MLTDSHTHLDFPEYTEDLDEVLSRAERAGVSRLLTIGTSLASSRRAVALAEQYSQVRAVVGIHPNAATEAGPNDLKELRELARSPRVAAIGETGLDYFRLPEGDTVAIKERQAEIFRGQLDLAAELGLNVVVHQRGSWEDTVAQLAPYAGRLRAVFHCFGEPPERAWQLFAVGHLISFTGIVTFKNAASAQASVRTVPADRYMVETDCPFLAPAPHRGTRCEPAYTRLIAEQVAALRGSTLEQVAAETEATVHSFFRLG